MSDLQTNEVNRDDSLLFHYDLKPFILKIGRDIYDIDV